jgi:hypothetical protein
MGARQGGTTNATSFYSAALARAGFVPDDPCRRNPSPQTRCAGLTRIQPSRQPITTGSRQNVAAQHQAHEVRHRPWGRGVADVTLGVFVQRWLVAIEPRHCVAQLPSEERETRGATNFRQKQVGGSIVAVGNRRLREGFDGHEAVRDVCVRRQRIFEKVRCPVGTGSSSRLARDPPWPVANRCSRYLPLVEQAVRTVRSVPPEPESPRAFETVLLVEDEKVLSG